MRTRTRGLTDRCSPIFWPTNGVAQGSLEVMQAFNIGPLPRLQNAQLLQSLRALAIDQKEETHLQRR